MSATLIHQGASTLGATLAISGASIVAVQMARRRPIIGSTLAQRWMTWAILAPLWLVASTWAPGRIGLLAVFATVAAFEFGRLHPALVTFDRWLLVGIAAVSMPVAALAGADPLALVAATIVASIVLPVLSQDVLHGLARIGAVMTGFLLVVLPFVMLDGLAMDVSGAVFFTVGLAVALSDVTAFVLGSTKGRRRIAPILSPNKTVAGIVGNFVGASAGVAIAVAVGIAGIDQWWLAPVVAAGAVAGDLTISMLKRHRGVKDAGAWLPGFGGLLDRVDSLLVVAPLVFAMTNLMGGA